MGTRGRHRKPAYRLSSILGGPHFVAYIFRYAALVIVFILRRRAFDNGFLDPDSELAGRVKDTFRRAIKAHQSGRFHVIGGAVDLPRALQQMIDYIDRRGMGSILLATADD